ncbi:Oidioi.mRNA.OKI2018_I69.XSR.g13959.t1.cds [Oikopleura dioica]|uniref:Oidioi.mRNA.OKI2018_I69.XSR.g13959.t1.cds n=1 Tax=Oikopleura dioica TaxID=34765 RepID=A0ABN7SDL3_OIKDI|nr:Oidioi.mRNA.OKI2018_I69.XSR.g13959.t1.cds [Oikopleura dioica]
MNPLHKPSSTQFGNGSSQPPVYFYNTMLQQTPNMTLPHMIPNQQTLMGNSQRGVVQPMMFYSPQVLKLPLTHQLANGFISKKKKCSNAILKNRKILKRAMLTIPDPLPEFIEKVKEIKKATENEDLFCKSCNLFLNSAQQLKAHVQSTKHKMIELGLMDRKADKKREIGRYKCKPCDCIMNSEVQLLHHLNSIRHQRTLEDFLQSASENK